MRKVSNQLPKCINSLPLSLKVCMYWSKSTAVLGTLLSASFPSEIAIFLQWIKSNQQKLSRVLLLMVVMHMLRINRISCPEELAIYIHELNEIVFTEHLMTAQLQNRSVLVFRKKSLLSFAAEGYLFSMGSIVFHPDPFLLSPVLQSPSQCNCDFN